MMSAKDLRKWRNNSGISALFFDGALKGNPGNVGKGGVIFDEKGTKQQEYAWDIGRETNNEAKWYALTKGLELAREMGTEEMNVIGDSLIVIREARKIHKN